MTIEDINRELEKLVGKEVYWASYEDSEGYWLHFTDGSKIQITAYQAYDCYGVEHQIIEKKEQENDSATR